MLAATTHEGALKAANLVLLSLLSWIHHIRASRLRVSSLVPGPLMLLCLSDRQADAVLLLDIAHYLYVHIALLTEPDSGTYCKS